MSDHFEIEPLAPEPAPPPAAAVPPPPPADPAAAGDELPPLAESIVILGVIAVAAISAWMLYGDLIRAMPVVMGHMLKGG